ncbi:hypothetical protein [Kribbella flavida]|nr:hypothetical protein [Kribbella flavida]
MSAHSTRSTPRLSCVLTRVSAAYAAVGFVRDGAEQTMHSPTLQVQ